MSEQFNGHLQLPCPAKLHHQSVELSQRPLSEFSEAELEAHIVNQYDCYRYLFRMQYRHLLRTQPVRQEDFEGADYLGE